MRYLITVYVEIEGYYTNLYNCKKAHLLTKRVNNAKQGSDSIRHRSKFAVDSIRRRSKFTADSHCRRSQNPKK